MKIRKLTPENYAKASALLRQTFPNNTREVQSIEKSHKDGEPLHEWVCIHTNRIIAYIAFSNAYRGPDLCGLHLGPMAVNHQFQKQEIGSELLKFSLRQPFIKENTIFVSGNHSFFKKFGFKPCGGPACPLDKKNVRYLSLCNSTDR